MATPAQAVVLVDETPVRSWSVNGRVYATKIVGDTVFVGGRFSAAVSPTGQSVARRNIAAFRLSDGSLVTGWRSDTSVVRALDSDGSALFVGGHATRVRKVSLATGANDRSFSVSVNGAVRGLDVEDGSLYIGGQFTSVNGVARSRVAKLSPATGAVVRAFEASVNGDVYAVRKNPAQSVLYVAGNFTVLSGSSRVGIGGVDSDTGASRGPALRSSRRPTTTLDVSSDGSRVFSGEDSNAVSGWRTSDGVVSWRRYGDGNIQAVHYFNGEVYVGFHDGFAGDTSVKLLAADATTGDFDPGFRPTMRDFWGVFAIDATAAGLAVGGEFRTVNGVTAGNWARFR